MIRLGRLALLPAALPLLVLAGCGGDDAAAMVACEQLVDRRVGVELQHLGPLEGETAEAGAGEQVVVRGGFTEPQGGRLTRYTCTVEPVDNGWRLVDLITDRQA